jgi:PAS domain-containing protein
VIDSASRLLPARRGQVWAVGSHQRVAAVACFDGGKWVRRQFPEVAWSFTNRAAFEAQDGSVWFGGDSPIDAAKGQKGGLVFYTPSKGAPDDPSAWTHLTSPLFDSVAFIGQSGDGLMWFGDKAAITWKAGRFNKVTDPKELVLAGYIEFSESAADGSLWLATRGYGTFRYLAGAWSRHSVADGLPSNCVGSVLSARDRSIWTGTAKGISRFDGAKWTTLVLPPEITIEPQNGWLLQSVDGSIWVNNSYREWMRRGLENGPTKRDPYIEHQTIRFQKDDAAPETEITLCEKEVSQPGNAIISWQGSDPWQVTRGSDLQYSYRTDEGSWSPFVSETNHIFLALRSGRRSFEIRARDQDFNVDPTPARVEFRVIPPIWLQPWFIATMAVLLGIIAYLTRHILLKARHLEEPNRTIARASMEMQKQAEELALANQRMNHELAERVKAEQAVRQNEAKIRQLYTQMKEAVAELDKAVGDISSMAEEVAAVAGEIRRRHDRCRRCLRTGKLFGGDRQQSEDHYQPHLAESRAREQGSAVGGYGH